MAQLQTLWYQVLVPKEIWDLVAHNLTNAIFNPPSPFGGATWKKPNRVITGVMRTLSQEFHYLVATLSTIENR